MPVTANRSLSNSISGTLLFLPRGMAAHLSIGVQEKSETNRTDFIATKYSVLKYENEAMVGNKKFHFRYFSFKFAIF